VNVSVRDAILQVEHVGVSFRGVRALDDVSFEIPKGGISAVIGPNGAGKTTLFNCISGVTRHKGDVRLADRVLTGLRADQRAGLGIARTFQTPLLINDLDAVDNVLVGAHTRTTGGVLRSMFRTGRVRATDRSQRSRANELLAQLGLERSVHQPVGALPHGDRRRVEVARALIAQPSLLLLDEPAAGLGADEAVALLSDVRAVGEHVGTTSVLVEHDVALVMSLSRHVIVLDAGKLLTVGDPKTVAADPRVVAAYLGDDWSEAA
jgi:branched-chain amino acid transport system ATP-binding protein